MTIVSTSTKTGTDAISRTSHSVSIGPACSEAGTGNQSISRASAMPSTEATAPIRSIWRSCARLSCEATGGWSLIGSSPRSPWTGHPTQPRRSIAAYSHSQARASALITRSGGGADLGRRPSYRAPAGAEVRRRDAAVAPERLGELGRLAVADAVGDLPHREHARGEQL